METYINLNVNLLFEQYNIKEIENLNCHIQNEVDGKKEELRTMVGERYRDLIQAADTILEMKFTCKRIENVINQNSPVKWNNQTSAHSLNEDIQSFDNLYQTATQIKMLMTLIESISSSLDEFNFFEATQLFLLSRHIYTCIKLEANAEITKKFPVVSKVWDVISPFQNAIKISCLKALEDKKINVDRTVNCLGSLILLENGEYISSLDTFIQIREKTLLRILDEENFETVQERIFETMLELVNTTQIIYNSFISCNGREGFLFQKFNSINSGDSPFLIKNPFLLDMKLNSKFKFQGNLGILDIEKIRMSVSQWTSSVKKIFQEKLKGVVKNIVSINTVREIENQTENIQKPAVWPNICSSMFNSKHIDFYSMFYQTAIVERIYNIINISWENLQSDFKRDIDKLTILINDRVHRQTSYYVWINDDMDNPQSLKDALNAEQKMHNLLMKVKGYNKYIVDICVKLDLDLKKLTDDLKQYILAKNLKSNNSIVSNEKLISYLKDCSKSFIYSLVSYVKSSFLNNDIENCHILARLLQAISEMCPNLKHCFSNKLCENDFFEESILEDSEQWIEIAQLLNNESMQLWRIWLTGFFRQWNELKVDKPLHSFNIIKDFPVWKCLLISEKGENDQDIESKIYIPQQLSITIQCWLFSTIDFMNKMIPHTLPRQIHLEIVEELNKRLYLYYRSLCKQNGLISNQKIAWQILFDLKVLMGLFTLRENKSEVENYQDLINECKSSIDPFDFDVFYPHIIYNIKDNIARLQYEMGLMVPYGNYSMLQNQNIIHVHDTEPNIVPMSFNKEEKNWIPLLPVITKTKGLSKELDNVKHQQQYSKKASIPVNTSSSALSSLQEWFK